MDRKPICQIKIPPLVLYWLSGSILLIGFACTSASSEQEMASPPAKPGQSVDYPLATAAWPTPAGYGSAW